MRPNCQENVLGLLDGLLVRVSGDANDLVVVLLLTLFQQLLCPRQPLVDLIPMKQK